MMRTFGFLVLLFLMFAPTAARSDVTWSRFMTLRSTSGGWCGTSPKDCFSIPRGNVTPTEKEYLLFGMRSVPREDAQPSWDGEYHWCRRERGPGHSCFFVPKEK